MTATKGYIVSYTTCHGTDVWLTHTERGARDSVYLIMLTNLFDLLKDETITQEEAHTLMSWMRGDHFDPLCEFWRDIVRCEFEVVAVNVPQEQDEKYADLLKSMMDTAAKNITIKIPDGGTHAD